MQRATWKRFALILLFIQSTVGFAQNALPTIQHYLQAHSKQWNVESSDLNELEIYSQASSLAPGTAHYYIRQKWNGIPIVNGIGSVVLQNNEVVHVNAQFVHLPSSPFSQPVFTAQQAVQAAFVALNLPVSSLTVKEENQKNQALVFNQTSNLKEPIPVRLLLRFQDGALQPIYEMSIYPTTAPNWWSLHVSALDGSILFKNDWVKHCSFDHSAANGPITEQQHCVPLLPPPPPGMDQYTVYALPVASPSHGDRTTVLNPSDALYSPFGWHDTNAQIGDEYTITRGNNVYASDDIDNDDLPGYSPDGGASLNFDYAYDSLVGVQGNLDAVITNLFYMNNMMHDIWAYYGFDEASGNFQSFNYSGNGLGDDFVFADAQDGSGTNNANFGTPPDGSNPRMQMYLWTSSNVPNLLTVNTPSAIATTYSASTAGFGPPVPTIPITEDVVLVLDDGTDNTDGCGVITNGAQLAGKIALVRRGNCLFATKVEACEAQGALAVIVMNNTAGSPIAMGGTSITNIPSIMISQSDGDLFVSTLNGGQTINATIVNPGDLTATDSDFDNMIIAHEYGHGISTRLVGGSGNADCLYNDEQMGEGWSDWLGLMLTMLPTDQEQDPRGVGTYVINEPTNGIGIRPSPYSTDFAVNNYTYGATNNSTLTMPHGIGFVWATMLWDLNWALINQYGWSADVKTGAAGNNKAMALIIEGMKLTACSPGFVDARDGILQADMLLYSGANQCLIWEVFARRGLGYSASQGSSASRSDQVEAFDVSPSCDPNAGIQNQLQVSVKCFPNPTNGNVTIDCTSYLWVSELSVTDITGKTIAHYSNITPAKMEIVLPSSSGVYFIQVHTNEGVYAAKISKTN
jgi:hypothetical protein